MGIVSFLRKLFYGNWIVPIERLWPYIITYIVLIGWQSVTKNPIPRWMLIFLHAYVSAGIMMVLRWPIFKWVGYAIIYILFLTELVLSMLFGMHLSPTILIILSETNGRESVEFFQTLPDKPNFWLMIVVIVMVAAINILLENRQKRISQMLADKRKMLITLRAVAAILLLGGICFSGCYFKLFSSQEMNDVDEWRSHMRNPDDVVTKLIVAIYDGHLASKEMKLANEQVAHLKAWPQSNLTDSVNVILVIGESYIKEHTPLYGYPLATTPFLCEEQRAGRLFAFTDVISPYNQTTRVVRNLLSCNSLGDGEHWSSAPPFTAVFKKNGYWVSMQDNQKMTDNNNLFHLFDFSLQTYLYHPVMASACYNDINNDTFEFDGQLIENYRLHHLQQDDNPNRKLIVFHLIGQHVSYEYRYPHDDVFSKFNIDSTSFRHEEWLTDKMRQEIADYDNATNYNDHVIHLMTQLYTNQSTVLVYLSDHGEEVYDYRPRSGRDDFKLGPDLHQSLRYQYNVPFFIWCSDKYIATHPDIIREIQQATGRPMMIDNTCHVLFHLAGLFTPYYKANRDVLSATYRCPSRLVNDDVIYDDVMMEH